MAQESLSLESSKMATPARLGWQGSSLRWKFVTAFGGLISLGCLRHRDRVLSDWERTAKAGRSTLSGNCREPE
jgi:hypothetical protein